MDSCVWMVIAAEGIPIISAARPGIQAESSGFTGAPPARSAHPCQPVGAGVPIPTVRARRIRHEGPAALRCGLGPVVSRARAAPGHPACEVLTTSQKLAHRIARELNRSFAGQVTNDWSDRDGELYAAWQREDVPARPPEEVPHRAPEWEPAPEGRSPGPLRAGDSRLPCGAGRAARARAAPARAGTRPPTAPPPRGCHSGPGSRVGPPPRRPGPRRA